VEGVEGVEGGVEGVDLPRWVGEEGRGCGLRMRGGGEEGKEGKQPSLPQHQAPCPLHHLEHTLPLLPAIHGSVAAMENGSLPCRQQRTSLEREIGSYFTHGNSTRNQHPPSGHLLLPASSPPVAHGQLLSPRRISWQPTPSIEPSSSTGLLAMALLHGFWSRPIAYHLSIPRDLVSHHLPPHTHSLYSLLLPDPKPRPSSHGVFPALAPIQHNVTLVQASQPAACPGYPIHPFPSAFFLIHTHTHTPEITPLMQTPRPAINT